jgi:hypothetical protein
MLVENMIDIKCDVRVYADDTTVKYSTGNHNLRRIIQNMTNNNITMQRKKTLKETSIRSSLLKLTRIAQQRDGQ